MTLRALIDSDAVTAPTRRALLGRLDAAPVTQPRALTLARFATLQAVCARLTPGGDGRPEVDVAGYMDAWLAEGQGDGWRYADMPPVAEALARGLDGIAAMAGGDFAVLEGAAQDAVLARVHSGDVEGEAWAGLSAPRFFEHLLSQAAQIYFADPAVQFALGYTGFADAHGWWALGLGRREGPEPALPGDLA